MPDIEKTLAERGKRYGEYIDQTEVTVDLHFVLMKRLGDKRHNTKSDQLDALYMICVKLSRIVNGDPSYVDNWADIAGYATLVARRLEGESND